jgi:hypothetical protein
LDILITKIMKRYISSTILVIGLFSLFSCAKKEPIAPDLSVISGPVDFGNPFAVSNSNPNFNNNDQIYFSATFNKETHWLITVTGNASGAVKTFEGDGTVISATNATWDGTANSVPSFRAEAVTATLSFPSSTTKTAPYPLSLTITIAAPKDLNYGHVLITDFSAGLVTGWTHDWAYPAFPNDIPLKNPDGNNYCTIGPIASWQLNLSYKPHISPYLDYLNIPASSVGYPTYFPLIADPSKIYFNMMVYNTVLPTYTWIEVILSENHPTIPDSIISKSINIYPNWNTGWKLVTVGYLDFKLADTTVTLNNPQKIRDVNIILLSTAPQAVLDAKTVTTGATFDHLIFSQYKPYQP